MTTAIWLALVLALGPATAWSQDILKIYATNCTNCHGPDGRGNTPLGRALKLTDLRSPAVQKLSEAELDAILSKGSGGGKMPGFEKKLGAEMVRHLAAYVHRDFQAPPVSQVISTAKSENTPDPGDVKSIYSTRCAHCHGADGSGDTVLGRELKLRDMRSPDAQDFSDRELTGIIASGMDRGRMPGFQKKLGQDMVEQLASYVRVLAGKPPIAKAQSSVEEEKDSTETASAPVPSGSNELRTNVKEQQKQQPPEVPRILGPSSSPLAVAGTKAVPSKLVDLNSASKVTLMTLPGLTEVEAMNIINGRPYKSTMQFKIRRIVPPETYAQIADRIIAKRPPKPKPPPAN